MLYGSLPVLPCRVAHDDDCEVTYLSVSEKCAKLGTCNFVKRCLPAYLMYLLANTCMDYIIKTIAYFLNGSNEYKVVVEID